MAAVGHGVVRRGIGAAGVGLVRAAGRLRDGDPVRVVRPGTAAPRGRAGAVAGGITPRPLGRGAAP